MQKSTVRGQKVLDLKEFQVTATYAFRVPPTVNESAQRQCYQLYAKKVCKIRNGDQAARRRERQVMELLYRDRRTYGT